MTVEDLIKKLKDMPPYLHVIILGESGNSSDINDIREVVVKQTTKFSGVTFGTEKVVNSVDRHCVLLSN
jgi:hypothetical protein